MNKEQLFNNMVATSAVEMTEVADILQIKDVQSWCYMLGMSSTHTNKQAQNLFADALCELNMNGLQKISEILDVDVLDLAQCIGVEPPYSLDYCEGLFKAAHNCKSYREDANLSIKQLSQKSGVDVRTITLFERGYHNIGLKDIDAIVEVLGITINMLIEDKPKRI